MAQFIQPDIPGAVNRGLQFAQQQRMNPLQIDAANLAIQGQEQDLRQGEQNIQFGQTRQKALDQEIDIVEEDRKNRGLALFALKLKSIPNDNRLQALLERKEQVLARDPNANTVDTDLAIKLTQEGRHDEVNQGADNVIAAGRNQQLIPAAQSMAKPTASQQNFETYKQLTARAQKTGDPVDIQLKEQFGQQSGFDKATPQNQSAIIPSVLLEGLDPELAEKGSAAFTAANGGKDGLTAFQKIVDSGTERQRRQASPALLKASFPKSSGAEYKQLQATMDAAETTEKGLVAATKVRVEQRRLKKAKGFQDRAVELLDNILASGEGFLGGDLGDVLGSVEGRIDTKLLSDDEAQVIADIEEAGNILTADNLSLMSGVLSETDIKILQNLAGGALVRTRNKDRFVKDVTTLRDKLSSKKVVTIDDKEEEEAIRLEQEKRDLINRGELPPSGREGGILNVDPVGVKAFVFPDGTFEEVP